MQTGTSLWEHRIGEQARSCASLRKDCGSLFCWHPNHKLYCPDEVIPNTGVEAMTDMFGLRAPQAISDRSIVLHLTGSSYAGGLLLMTSLGRQ